jgi:hypothetical protein
MDPRETPDWALLAFYAVPFLLGMIAFLLARISGHLVAHLDQLQETVVAHETRLTTVETVVKLRQLDRSAT